MQRSSRQSRPPRQSRSRQRSSNGMLLGLFATMAIAGLSGGYTVALARRSANLDQRLSSLTSANETLSMDLSRAQRQLAANEIEFQRLAGDADVARELSDKQNQLLADVQVKYNTELDAVREAISGLRPVTQPVDALIKQVKQLEKQNEDLRGDTTELRAQVKGLQNQVADTRRNLQASLAARAGSEGSATPQPSFQATKENSPTTQGSEKSDVTSVAKEQTRALRFDDTGWRHTTTTGFPPAPSRWPTAPATTTPPVIYWGP